MKPELNSIMLIDDSYADNLFHSIVIEEANLNKKVTQVRNGLEAINYLKSINPEEQPNLIFLDYNMPKMNATEFIEAYDKLEIDNRENVKIILLTTSLSPFDMDKVTNMETIDSFRRKPLTMEMLNEILEESFS